MSYMRRRRVFIGLGVSFCCIVGLATCHAPQPAQNNDALPVTVSRPIVKNIEEWDEYTGRFQAVDSVDVRSRISGYLQSVNFRDGEVVQKGQLMFVIDQRPYRVAVEQAKASLDEANAKVEFARGEYARAQELVPRGFISVSVLDQRRQNLQVALATVESASAALRDAQLNLNYTEIRAPITGRTGAKSITQGNLVTGGSGQGTLLTTLVSLNPIHFVFDADEAAYLKYVRLAAEGKRPSSRDKPNPVQVQLQGEQGWPHTGSMDFVDNRIDPGSGTMRGRAIMDNPGNLFIPGMFGRMRLLGSGHYNAILVPDEAIGSDQTAKVVFVVQPDETIAPRPVQLGPIVDGLRVVRNGLKADEKIVINGLVRLRPGLKVKPVDGRIELPTMAEAGGPAK